MLCSSNNFACIKCKYHTHNWGYFLSLFLIKYSVRHRSNEDNRHPKLSHLTSFSIKRISKFKLFCAFALNIFMNKALYYKTAATQTFGWPQLSVYNTCARPWAMLNDKFLLHFDFIEYSPYFLFFFRCFTIYSISRFLLLHLLFLSPVYCYVFFFFRMLLLKNLFVTQFFKLFFRLFLFRCVPWKVWLSYRR